MVLPWNEKIITSVSNKPMVVTLSNIWMKVSSKYTAPSA